MQESDFLVIGAGIAGAYAGYGLAEHGRTVVLEQESQPGYHTTGRSAAFYAETYGNAHIRALTTGSKTFYQTPPAGFAEHPLIGERGALFLARESDRGALAAKYQDDRTVLPGVSLMDAAEAMRMVPALRADFVAEALWDPECRDIDVAALHQGFLRALRARGGKIRTDARVTGLEWRGGRWVASTVAGEFAAPVVVNAAGAWGDEVAALAGIAPVGLTPKRRTVITFPAERVAETRTWPLVIDIHETFYFKPESGGFLASPCDETPMPPCDVQPDEMDVAVCVDRVQRAADLPVPRILSKWAGLRTFAPDKTPVVGFEPGVDGFFWLVGQGGYGIQTAPAMAQLCAALAIGGEVPPRLHTLGVHAEALSPARWRGQ